MSRPRASSAGRWRWSATATASRSTCRAAWVPPKPHYPRGYGALHARHILQANEGCDLDFLAGRPGAVGEPDIF